MSIHNYLPQKSKDTVLVQGKVDKELRKKTAQKMKSNSVTWDEFLTAACKAYLDNPKKE